MSSKILVLAAVVALMASAIAVDSVTAGKPPKVDLSYQIYSFADGTFVVDYIVQSKNGGKMDLGVSHECFSDGELVQARTSRLLWRGKGQDKAGHWNLSVQAGSECSAVVVDLDQTASGALSLATSSYAEVSQPVHYMVE